MKTSSTTFFKFILLSGAVLIASGKTTAQCNPPTPATASPSTFCAPGGTTNLNAISAGNQINWYTVPTGGMALGSVASGVNYMVTTAVTTTYYAESFQIGAATSNTYNYTGNVQSFTIPNGITSITVNAAGAQGGGNGGLGGRVTCVFPVTPGDVLNIYVGGQGAAPGSGALGGYNGGGNAGICNVNFPGSGGGGASDIRLNGVALANRVIVAGGGGGVHQINGNPGAGGGLTGGNVSGSNGCIATYATGGSQIAGGNSCTSSGICCTFVAAVPAGLGTGGPGAGPSPNCNNGDGGAGGGGGYYGGGGGGTYSSGGGGSSYTDPLATNVVHTQGNQPGNGQVIISYNLPGCVSASRTPVIVTVLPMPVVTITGSLEICAGNSTVLQANGATSYTWNTGSLLPSINVAPPTTTSYSVAGLQGVCTGTAAVTVTVNPIPNVTIVGNNTVCAGTSINLLAGGATTYTWSTGDLTANITPSPNSNITYTVLGMNPTGCYTTAVHSVTVNAIPTVTVTGPNAMCINQTITLNGFGATTYSWSNGSITSTVAVSPPIGTNAYTLTGYSALGCASAPLIKTIVTNPLPDVNITSTETLICKGMTATLTADGANTYSWSTGALTPTISVSPSVTASYTTVGTNTATGCYTTAIMTVYVSPCTGVDAIVASSENLSIYPNPNNGEFVVEFKNGKEKNIRVVDLVGRQVVNTTSSDDRITVNISDLANGIYYVRVQSDTFTQVIKVVKQ